MFRYVVAFTTGAVHPVGPRGLLIPQTEECEAEWAPLEGDKVCQDRAQRWRQEHSWDKDGRCIFCCAHHWSDTQ
jgi:hypothetical protein